MVEFSSVPRRPRAAQRRDAMRAIRPALSSARLVRLFQKIGMLAVTSPATIVALELAVDRMAHPKAARASLPVSVPRVQHARGKR